MTKSRPRSRARKPDPLFRAKEFLIRERLPPAPPERARTFIGNPDDSKQDEPFPALRRQILLDRQVTRGSICSDAKIAHAAHSWLGSCARECGPGAAHSSVHAGAADRLLHKSQGIIGARWPC